MLMLSNIEIELLERIANALETIAENTSPLMRPAKEETTEDDSADEVVLSLGVVALDLPVRTINVFLAYEIRTLKELLLFNKKELLKMRGLGRKTLWQVTEALQNLRLELPEVPSISMQSWIRSHNLKINI